MRSNESFSGKGHKQHICKECQALPRSEREAIEQQHEIRGFMEQRNISEKNIARLRVLAASPNPATAELAQLGLAVALIRAHRRHRWKHVAQADPSLFSRAFAAGFIPAYSNCDDPWNEHLLEAYWAVDEQAQFDDAQTNDASDEEIRSAIRMIEAGRRPDSDDDIPF